MELVIDNVGKKYRGNFWAIKNFSLKIKPGVFGLLGQNGAGKSTLMKMIATVCTALNKVIRLVSKDTRNKN